MKIHICLFDKECWQEQREYGMSLTRVYVSHGDWGLHLALAPSGKFQKFDWKTRRYGDKWGWITLRPPRHWCKDINGDWLPRETPPPG